MIKKILTAALFSIVLVGCASTTVVTREVRVPINVPTELLDCSDKVKNIKIPNSEKLTNGQIISYISSMRRLLSECSKDNDSIKQLITEINQISEELNKRQ